MPLITVAEARQRILADVRHEPTIEAVPLLGAAGRFLAVDQLAQIDVPPADNSAMDGYAVEAASITPGRAVAVTQRIPAGRVGVQLEAGTAARIFTGAELPPGADAVVMQEDCEATADSCVVTVPVEAGANVRPRGQDIRQGDCLVAAGARLGPAALALLASVGIASVPVFKPLRVAVLCTGNELVEPGEVVGPGQIYNSNRTLLAGLIAGLSFEVVDLGSVEDTPEAIEATLRRGAAQADCILSSGGVSVGEEDHVKGAVEQLGALQLWKIAVKPGKPLAYGRVQRVPFFGLPGNPVSAFVTFKLFVEPYLRQLQSGVAGDLPCWRVRAGFEWRKAGGREEYLRVRLAAGEQGMVAELFGNQSSGVLTSVAWADGLACVEAGRTLAKGDWLDVIPLRWQE